MGRRKRPPGGAAITSSVRRKRGYPSFPCEKDYGPPCEEELREGKSPSFRSKKGGYRNVYSSQGGRGGAGEKKGNPEGIPSFPRSSSVEVGGDPEALRGVNSFVL